MVTRAPNPALVTDMMANGTTDRLSMSAPGSTPVVNPPATAPLHQLAANGGTPSATVEVNPQSGRVDGNGRPHESTQWVQPAGHGRGGFEDC